MPRLRAVIPAAGLGTRLLPVTRVVPKELLPLGRMPVLEHVVRELLAAGVDEIVLVTAPHKEGLLTHLRGMDGVPVTAVVQATPLGLGDAVLQAASICADAPFVVVLPDALVPPTVVASLLATGRDGAIAVERVPPDRAEAYGIVDVDADGVLRGLVEKPPRGTAPSDLAVAGRYLLPPSVFTVLRDTAPGAGGEVQLTDAIARLIRDGARLAAVPLPDGVHRRDVGSPTGYAAAFVEHALADEALAPAVRAVFAT